MIKSPFVLVGLWGYLFTQPLGVHKNSRGFAYFADDSIVNVNIFMPFTLIFTGENTNMYRKWLLICKGRTLWSEGVARGTDLVTI